MKQYASIDDTVYFWFASNDTGGSGDDGAAPAADVRLAGAGAAVAPMYSPVPILLTAAGYPPGAYEVAITASVANGFAADNTYAVFCTLAVDAQNPTGFVGSFDTMPVQANAIEISGDSGAADNAELAFDGTGYGFTNCTMPTVTTLTGHTVQSGDSFGRIGVTGSGLTTLAQAAVCTEVRLAELAAANLPTDVANVKAETALIVADTNELQTDWVNGGRLDLILDRILAATEIRQTSVNDVGATTTKFETNLAEVDNNFWDRGALLFTSGNNSGQMRRIKSYVGASKEITLQTPLNVAPANADTFLIVAARAFLTVDIEDIVDQWETQSQADPSGFHVNAMQISGDAAAADNIEAQYDGTGYAEDSAPATQEQVGRLATGSAAINTVAESFTKAGAEPETNTFAATVQLDGVAHIVEDDAGPTDCYYQFDVGGNGVPVNITWQGYANSQGDSYAIFAYNYGGTAYEQIGTITAVNGTTIREEIFALSNAHVGTGINLGKVRFRFQSADGTAFATDRLLCAYSVVTKSVGYSDGAIWVNTNAANTNTEDYVDGTADNPVSTWAAAKTISASMGIKKFHIVNGSTITLDANSDNYTFVGHEWTLALGGQSITNTHIENAIVSGISAGVGAHFRSCDMGICSLTQCNFTKCRFPGEVITLLSAGIYVCARCGTGGGVTPPTFDYGAALGNSQVVFSDWSGGVKIKNLNAAGADKVSIIGNGKLTLDSTCAGGTIGIHGSVTITDNVVGGFTGTINENGRYDIFQIKDQADSALSDVHLDDLIQLALTVNDGAPNAADFITDSIIAIDDWYNQNMLLFTSGALAGLARYIDDYDGGTKRIYLTEAFPQAPANTDDFVIVGISGSAPTGAAIADAVWDELEAGHVLGGSFGEEVTKQGKKLDRNLILDL